jgi:hypothetical protein
MERQDLTCFHCKGSGKTEDPEIPRGLSCCHDIFQRAYLLVSRLSMTVEHDLASTDREIAAGVVQDILG